MSSLVRTLVCTVLALAAGMASFASVADEQTARYPQWAASAARQAEEAQHRQREARLRWAYERRRSAAHARMPNTLYASTPSAQAHTDLSCPALVDEDTRRIYRRFVDRRDGGQTVLGAPGLARASASGQSGITVFPANRQSTSAASSWPSSAKTKDDAGGHLIQASGWTTAQYQSKSTTEGSQQVYLFPSASEPLREGFVRVINHSAEAGEVTIDPVDDSGREFDTITLSIDANETVHFNSGDLETGNEGKGLSGSTGSGQGGWRLAFSSELDIEVLSYIRTEDGFLTAMHDVAPVEGDIHQVAIFNPGSNRNQVSRLRLINPTDATAEVTIGGTDDKGMPGSGEVSLSLDAGTTREITAEQLESGGTGLAGMLGDGSGKWRLQVESEQAVVAMSLLESPTDHLTNLSTVPELPEDGVHGVPLFPAAGDDSGRQGFVRAINRSDTAGEIHIKAYDETERDYEAVVLTIGGNEVVHFNSDDLEQGSPQKRLSGGTGAGEGDWRLELTSDLEIEVLSYIRTTDGFLTAMHDVAPSAGTRHRVAVFNPGSNRNQESLLRLVNPGDGSAEVTITGVDDRGAPGDGEVTLSVPGGGLRTVGAWELESGADRLTGMLGDGSGKWQLTITSDLPVVAMSLLRSPTGHLTNLSTAPGRGARGSTAEGGGQTAEDVFRESISPIVQSKCVNCHVEGGASGNTRLVFVTDADEDHLTKNLSVLEDFLAEVKDGADYVLNKIQGVSHGGGIQVAAGTDEYADMARFLSLPGEDVGPVAITPATLFDGVKMESWRSTLRRAAIVFAGRIPTAEEYAAIDGGTGNGLLAAIRSLMHGPEFHEFLVRAANDRLLTDRRVGNHILGLDYFVEYANTLYDLNVAAAATEYQGEAQQAVDEFHRGVQYGAARAPLELIAYVVESDLPYTEVLTADYIMANPTAAQAYGADTAFAHRSDMDEFKPSRIVSYYRRDESQIQQDDEFGQRFVDPGNLATNYPHAGILNTTTFLLRYPTTATNRNRARSRWTYYHFLGVDVEKSAPRTTDPVALADTNTPTMNNPACTVCHSVLDPVAGAFQNYGDEGWYRDKWGGLDSLDEFYKDGFTVANRTLEVVAARESPHVVTIGAYLDGGNGGKEKLILAPRFDPPRPEDSEIWWHMGIDHVELQGASGNIVQHVELQDVVDEMDLCGSTEQRDGYYVPWFCTQEILLDVPDAGDYEVELVLWFDGENRDGDATERRRMLDMSLGGHVEGDTWYRDMRTPGFDGKTAPNPENSLQWLAGQIVADRRFAEATVKFWWPAIIGRDVAEPPEDENDADFEGRLLASNAQTAEVERLARGFRRGFRGGPGYNLKDLLVEMVLSRWFRASRLAKKDPVRAVALRDSGAKRLLTPEELSRKTVALTGFDWQRSKLHDPARGAANWTNAEDRYGLLYGGIDSDGITQRGRDLTPVMAGVAQRLAAATSCPVVMKDFYLVPPEGRRLFAGVSKRATPIYEFGSVFDVEAESRRGGETASLSGELTMGDATVTVAFVNNETGDDPDRNLHVDRLDVRDANGIVVASRELEEVLDATGCEWNVASDTHFSFYCNGALEVGVPIPVDGRYTFEVLAWADQNPQGFAKLDLTVGTDAERSAGARAIRSKLAELYDKLLGVEADASSPEIQAAYDLFVDVWERARAAGEDWDFLSLRCDYAEDHHYFDGIADNIWRDETDEHGNPLGWDRERMHEFISHETDTADPHYVARTWVTVLAFLMTDYRYLHL